MSDTPPGQRVPDGNVHQRRDLGRHPDHLVVLRHVHIQLVQRNLLLVPGPEHLSLLHAGEGEDRHVIELGVVKTVEEVDGARAGGGQAYSEPAGGFGISRSHEGGGFLVMDEDELDPVR